jgi:hypothetical protein
MDAKGEVTPAALDALISRGFAIEGQDSRRRARGLRRLARNGGKFHGIAIMAVRT